MTSHTYIDGVAALEEALEHHLAALIAYLVDQGRTRDAFQLLTSFQYMLDKVRFHGVTALLGDYRLALAGLDTLHPNQRHQLEMVRDTLQICGHIIDRDPMQLASQLLGRLLPGATRRSTWRHADMHQGWQTLWNRNRGIAALLRQAQVWRGAIWLRPQSRTMGAPGRLMLQTVGSSNGTITAMALTPDGRWIVTGGSDGTARVISSESGEETATFTRHQMVVDADAPPHDLRQQTAPSPIMALVVAPDGRSALTWGSDHRVRWWDLMDGTERCAFHVTNRVLKMALSRDTRFAAIAHTNNDFGDETRCGIYALPSGIRRFSFAPAPRVITQEVVLSSDDRFAVTTHDDGSVRVWDIASARILHSWQAPDKVSAVYMSPAGDMVAAASLKDIWVWHMGDGRLIKHLRTDWSEVVTSIVAIIDTRYLVSAGPGGLITWDLRTGMVFHCLHLARGLPLRVATLTDRHRRLVVATDQAVQIWDFAELLGRRVWLRRARCYVLLLLFFLLGKWSSFKLKATHYWIKHALLGDAALLLNEPIAALAFSPAGDRVVLSRGSRLEQWRPDRPARLGVLSEEYPRALFYQALLCRKPPIGPYYGHLLTIRGIGFVDNDRVVSVGEDSKLRIIERTRGLAQGVYMDYPGRIHALAVFADGKRVMIGGGRGLVRGRTIQYGHYPLQIIDWRTARVVMHLPGHQGLVSAVVLTSDERYAISSGCTDLMHLTKTEEAHMIKIWDLHHGTCIMSLPGHGDIHALALAERSMRLISASTNGTLAVWNLAQQPPQRILLYGHTGMINAVAVTPDEQYVISVANDMSVRVWQLTPPQCVATLMLETANMSCAIAPDGRQVVVGDSNGTVHFLILERPDQNRPCA